MAIYFMGGEDIDFSPLGTVSVQTGAGNFRSDFARCALGVAGGAPLANGWRGAFSAPANAFWFGLRAVVSSASLAADPGQPLVVLSTSGSKRLGLSVSSGMTLVLGTWDSTGAYTKLIASAAGAVPSTLFKLDAQVLYATTGQVRVFVNQVEVITYAGDITRSGATNLDSIQLACPSTDASVTSFSEIFVTDRDSRTLMLKTHAPVNDAGGNQWTGNYQQVADVTADETTVISTNATDQVSSFPVTQLPTGSNLAIRGFKIAGYAARGETGPSKLDLGVVTNNTTSFGPDAAIDTGWTRIGQVFENNPVTNAQWTSAEINALSISVKSKT